MKRLMLLPVVFVLLFTAPTVAAVGKTAIERAVERGVAALKRGQRPDGTWANYEQGSTALVGLTLLECGLPASDPVVRAAVKTTRGAAPSLTGTYALALSVLFLDRLDDPADTPLIESMLVRLLAGQTGAGTWTYTCPVINATPDGTRVLRGGRNLRELPAKGKRGVTDLPPELQAQLAALARVQAANAANTAMTGDNSNTQFATLALWVGRRYGVPTQGALLRVSQFFRATQNADGGWGYNAGSASTATMTCAGVLALVCGHGAALDIKKSRDASITREDVSKDIALRAGLLSLSTAVGVPLGWRGDTPRPAIIQSASGKAYYYLWSLERVCLALDLDLIHKRDWYHWGAELLVANQMPDGTWQGDYTSYGNADTCFALLFLRKTNLVRDLTAGVGLKGEARVLRAGGPVGDDPKLARVRPLSPSGIDAPGREATRSRPATTTPDRPLLREPRVPDAASSRVERPAPGESEPAARLADALTRAPAGERPALLARLRDGKGVAHTEALLGAIARLDAAGRNEARHALAERISRMKDKTLSGYLGDADAELRRAAVLAVAARDERALIPQVIVLLDDRDGQVRRAAHVALKQLTGLDFGPPANAGSAERKTAVAAWQRWWQARARE